MGQNPLYYYIQQSPAILAPGTGFMEDDFPMDWGGREDGFRMIQVNYI